MSETRYAETHEWARLEDGLVVTGITDHAVEALGDIVAVDLPAAGKAVKAGKDYAAVESTKAASDVYAPVDGEIVAVNEALIDAPEKVHEGPENVGWFVKIKPAAGASLDHLMDKNAYAQFVAEEG